MYRNIEQRWDSNQWEGTSRSSRNPITGYCSDCSGEIHQSRNESALHGKNSCSIMSLLVNVIVAQASIIQNAMKEIHFSVSINKSAKQQVRIGFENSFRTYFVINYLGIGSDTTTQEHNAHSPGCYDDTGYLQTRAWVGRASVNIRQCIEDPSANHRDGGRGEERVDTLRPDHRAG